MESLMALLFAPLKVSAINGYDVTAAAAALLALRPLGSVDADTSKKVWLN